MGKKGKLYSVPDKDFIAIIKSNIYLKDILVALGYSGGSYNRKKSILKRADELGVSTEHISVVNGSPIYTSRFHSIADDEFEKIVKLNYYMVDILEELGYSRTSGTMSTYVKQRAERLGIDLSHLLGKRGKRGGSRGVYKYPLEDVLVENSTYNRTKLKERLVKAGLLEYKCILCGNEGLWNGKLLTLELDHINGKNNDNRLKNLRILCPNCHSQTETFSGRNNKSS